MAPDTRFVLANLATAGAWLAAHGRPLWGLASLLPAFVGATVVVAATALAEPDQVTAWRGAGVGITCAALTLAALLATWDRRRRRIDPKLVRTLHAEAARAYLRNEWPAALAAAQQLTVAAPEESGAWTLLAMICKASGDAVGAARAEQRAAACAERG
ncbi:hypothetical protein LBMAG53_19680 [Planctomycetota bacterium]|nr:hypothetical protein LBMAG53_19680 [Planctomycetota bacterium]